MLNKFSNKITGGCRNVPTSQRQRARVLQMLDVNYEGDIADESTLVYDIDKGVFDVLPGGGGGGIGPKTFSGDPEGVVTPAAVGQIGIDLLVNSDGGHDTYIAVDVALKKRQKIYVSPNA